MRNHPVMRIQYGYHIDLSFNQPTPLICLMDVHPSRRGDILRENGFETIPTAKIRSYVDSFGNLCRRLEAPRGTFTLHRRGVIEDSGLPDVKAPDAMQHAVSDLPDDTLVYLMGSRYCETDLMSSLAWSLFGHLEGGWDKVAAVCDYVHGHLQFSYPLAQPTRTAFQAHEQGIGVCRDFAHLAITFCRCLNIPARYCNGYLGDIGVPPDAAPMDFNAWFEAYIGGRWHTFDPRHNRPRIGRILISRGRDAADVPMINSFGPHGLLRFDVITEEATGEMEASA